MVIFLLVKTVSDLLLLRSIIFCTEVSKVFSLALVILYKVLNVHGN